MVACYESWGGRVDGYVVNMKDYGDEGREVV